ncbi:MAG: L,D-transpeptidase family protein [Novosphingobium sp.]
MKFNPLYAGIGAMALGVAGLGALVLRPLDGPAKVAAPVSAPAQFAQADAPKPSPAAPPKDEGFVVKRILPINGPIKYGEWHWDEKGVPGDGPLVITVDLDARVLSVFRGGYEIGATAVLLGFGNTPTPTGIFPVKWKDADHHSSTYDNAPMPWTMNLTPDGVAIHGTQVAKGYASHGCVGVPNDFAKKIFAITPVGTKVYITRGKMVKEGESLVG